MIINNKEYSNIAILDENNELVASIIEDTISERNGCNVLFGTKEHPIIFTKLKNGKYTANLL